jgi:hypothetical protein
MLLTDIAFDLDMEKLLRRVRVEPGGDDAEAVEALASEAVDIARPKGVYRVANVDSRDDETVKIDGVDFKSRVLAVNLEDVYRVFPFVATCGRELKEWSQSIEGVLEPFWADTIKEMALRTAVRAIRDHIADSFQPGRTAEMNPGSLEDWPLSEQKGVFSLLDDPGESIGVELTDSFLMVPTKSISGILFPAEFGFENCQLCPRKDCPGRRAPYDEELWQKKYARENA